MVLGFKKREFFFVAIVVLLIAGTTKLNLIDSYRKSRDVTRKNDLGDVMDRLQKFHDRLGFYPPSNDAGQIVGCQAFLNFKNEWQFSECVWGENPVNSSYFNKLPIDPKVAEGYQYRYISTGESYQLFVGLEGSREDEYDPLIVARGLRCGSVVCTAGRTNLSAASLRAPLPTPLQTKK